MTNDTGCVKKMEGYIEKNINLWNDWTNKHIKSDFYFNGNTDDFIPTLKPIEIEELGNVYNKTLLHLQCHFGLDTLSWAQRGAITTGVDFSDESIKNAKFLSRKYQISSDFICANILDSNRIITEQYDVVFTSYGVLEWLPDLEKWAQIISSRLKKGGVFYIIEFHPLLNMFDDQGEKFCNPYFFREAPLVFEENGSYAEKDNESKLISYTWPHSVSEIITALIEAGIKIEHFHEFGYSSYKCFTFLKEKAKDVFILDKGVNFPHMFSIRGTKI